MSDELNAHEDRRSLTRRVLARWEDDRPSDAGSRDAGPTAAGPAKPLGRGEGPIPVLIFVILLLIAGFAALQFRYARNLDAVEERLDVAETRASAALEAAIPPSAVKDANASVYLVLKDGNPFGTAFVIDRERGVLATAAHVAEHLELNDPDEETAIINRFTGAKVNVAGAKLHAGYGAFKDLVESYQPIDPESAASQPRPVPLSDLPHDAALLLVNPIDPETGENRLGPDLPIADDATLKALAPGDAIAVIGFASDIINSTSLDFSAAPRSDRGIVSALLAPIDIVEDSGDPRFDSLIIHRMTGAPGMSGGPIINRNGAVVGIHTHGIATPQSNGDSVAQRADLIRDMLTPLREEDQVANVLMPEWRRRLERWPRARDVLPALLKAAYEPNYAVFAEKTVADILAEDQATEFRTIIDREFGERIEDFLLPAAELEPTETRLARRKQQRNSDAIPADAAQGFMIDGPGQFAVQRYRTPAAFDHIIFAFDYTVGRNPICRVKLFARRVGDNALKVTSNHIVPSLRFEAKRDAEGEVIKNDKVDTLEIVAKRSGCSFADNSFFIGVVSWDPTEVEDADPTGEEPADAEGETGGVLAGLASAGGDLKAMIMNAVGRGETPGVFTAKTASGAEITLIAAEALPVDAFTQVDVNETAMTEAATLGGEGLFSAPSEDWPEEEE